MYFFLIWTNSCSICCSSCCFLTCIHISQDTGKVVWYSHLFKNFPHFVVIHIIKGFSVNKEAEVDVFLELPCFLHDLMNAGNFISGSSASSKSILYIWKFLAHVLLKGSLKDLEYNLPSMWNECKIFPFFEIWMKTDLFQSDDHCWVFKSC